MEKKKLIFRMLCGMMLSVWFAFGVFPDCTAVRAATGVTLTITDLEVGDFVEIYRIASYQESDASYVWESTVKDWIQNKPEGREYKGLAPEQLSQMKKESAIEFCRTLIVGLKNESKGIANLDGYTFPVNEEKDRYQVENVSPGYYIILPKGATRIYEIKWLKIAPETEPAVSYDASPEDYQLPAVTTVAENKTADRGMVREGIFALEGDEVEVVATLLPPSYPDMYATGKRILNITAVIPRGLDYVEDSIELSLTDSSAYSMGKYEKATVYENADGQILFFGTPQEYYYELNGNLLVSKGTAQEALDKYNEVHESAYKLEEEEKIVLATDAATEDVGQTVNTENVSELVAEDDSITLTADEGMTIFVIALDTEQKESEIILSYKAKKNGAANDTGFYRNRVAFSYSVSPLDANLVRSACAEAPVSAYGVTIVACEGSGASVSMTAEEKLQQAPRFSGVIFDLYRLTQIYEGDRTEEITSDTAQSGNETESGTESGMEENELPRLIYNSEQDKTYEYVYVTSLTTNAQGVTSIGGLEATEYLVEQKVYPNGYTLSDSSLVINEEAWADETVMEGNNDLFVIWLEYETRYLPGTGKQGIAAFVVLGSLISMVALFLLFERYHPYGLRKFWKKSRK